MTANDPQYTGFEIAIIGMACRFPGARNWRTYWDNLINGVESIRFFTDPGLSDGGKVDFIGAGVELPRKELFDSFFFNYRPEDASLLNPSHRMFHECVWEALEDAGYDPYHTKGTTGLYAGAGDDLNWKVYSMLKNIDQRVDRFTVSQLNNKDYLSSLLSYKLDLEGPAFSVNTACSTSLVAIHLACKSLLMGEARIAIAGAVSIRTEPQKGYVYQQGMILSSDGHCRAFDKDASGTINGEGAGAIVLKRLRTALSDGDNIYAVIKGSAINNDGNRKVGFTAPAVEGQAACIRMAHEVSRVKASSIGYVEAHGTGTRLGDPVEVEALNTAFGNNKDKHCILGSVKTNLGHLDTAAGMAGLIKAALCLKYRQIPPTLHFREPNPEIRFEEGPFYVNTELVEWQRQDGVPLRAGVSSFGIGGTNAHVVLEEAPAVETATPAREHRIITLSARTENALDRCRKELRDHLGRYADIDMDDLAYTLQTGRKHFEYRKSIVCGGREELQRLLGSGEPADKTSRSIDRSDAVVFLFPGQGAQYAGMGKGLYEKVPFFRTEMDRGFTLLQQFTGKDFKHIVFGGEADKKQIDETRYAQPLLFILEYALAGYLMSLGITARCMIGHSIGEYVAACLSGVFSYEDALRIVIRRGELMYDLPAGIMLSVPVPEAEAKSRLIPGTSLAAVNSPTQVVLSGEPAAMQQLMLELEEEHISYVRLHTSHAFHSGMMDPIMDEFRYELGKVTLRKPQIPFVSNLSGRLIKDEEACSPDYWVRHMRGTVRFSDGVDLLLAQGREALFIEMGPGHSLTSLIKQHPASIKPALVNLIRHPRQAVEDERFLSEAIGRLWSLGIEIQWSNFHGPEKRKKMSLPTYPFENMVYPAEVDPFSLSALSSLRAAAPGGQELKDWIYYPIWKSVAGIRPQHSGRPVRCLFFSLDDDLSGALKSSMMRTGVELIEVIPGEVFRKTSGYRYTVNPSSPSEFKLLTEHLLQDTKEITDIVYAWTTAVDPALFELREDNRDLHLAYFSLVYLIRNLSHIKALSNRRITVVTDRLYNVTGAEEQTYASSLALGLLNALPQEYDITCCNIDIDSRAIDPTALGLIAGQLYTEPAERIVAIRNGKRWIPDHQKNEVSLKGATTVLKREGIYLITGGAGKVGMTLAKYLREHYQAVVILLGRKDTPPDGIDGSILYYRTDITQLDDLRQRVSHIETTIGPVTGVIHAAGVTDHAFFELVEDITFQNTMTLFAPKVKGIENIHAVFRHKNLDFMWVTSSLAASLGGVGYGSYAAANVYMDHFISSKCRELPGWKCVQLGEMVFGDDPRYKDGQGRRIALNPRELWDLFEWSLMVEGQPVILETTEDLFSRIRKVYVEKKKHRQENEAAEEAFEKTDRPSLKSSYAPPETETEKILVGMLENFFAVKDIGVEDNFFELGGDSLKAMIFLKRIEQTFRIKPSMEDFFNATHVRQLCEDIDERIWINKSTGSEVVVSTI